MIWSLTFRLLSYLGAVSIFQIDDINYINLLFNVREIINNINQYNVNEIYIKQFENNFYLTQLCNEGIINELKSIKFDIKPQPYLIKLLFNSGFVVLLLFIFYITKNVITNYENKIYKLLIISLMIYLFFIQSSLLILYQGLIYQIYMYKNDKKIN